MQDGRICRAGASGPRPHMRQASVELGTMGGQGMANDAVREVVLVGLGHAHLFVAKRAPLFARHGLRLTLIDDGAFWYSSIGSGLLGGRYEREDDVIEAEDFAQRCGIAFRRGRAAALDRGAREVVLEDGGRVPYDLVSLNVGSRVAPPFPAALEAPNVWGPKPIEGLLALRETLRAAFGEGRTVRLVTVGGNHSGAELTCNAMALARAEGGRIDATLVCEADELITNEPRGARRKMRAVLEGYGVNVRTGTRVASVDGEVVVLEGGERLAHDHAIVATGLAAAPLVMACDLPADPKRGLLVTPQLHSPEDDRVFAAGDCADIRGYDLPKVGVFGVRASPVLARNLIRRAQRLVPDRYTPQRTWFAAQNLGDGTGLASWGPVWWRGRSALWLKDWNDRRFMELYR